MKVVKYIQEQNMDTMFLCYVTNKETINYCCIPVKVFQNILQNVYVKTSLKTQWLSWKRVS